MAELTQDTISITIKSSAEQASKKVKNLSDKLNGLKIAIGGIGVAKFASTMSHLGERIFDLVNKTNSYIEAMNLFRTTMGNSADEAQKFVDKAEQILGLDPSQMMTSLSEFQSLGEGFGLANDEAYKMSQNLTQLAADMMSFKNISFDAALQKIKSGFSGELEPMRAVGVALDKVTLQQTAYNLGINKSIDSMTRAQKTELIYYQMMTSSASQFMQGDLARSLISPANALRTMKNEFNSLGRAVGSIFIPIMMKIIPVVRAITQLATEAAKAIAKMFGFNLGDYTTDISNVGSSLTGVSSEISDIGDSAKETTKDLNKMLMPFDELNNVTFSTPSSSTTGSGAGGAGGGSLGIDLPEYDMFAGASDEMTKKVEEMKEKIKELLPIAEAVAGAIAGIFVVKKVIDFITWIAEVKTAFKELEHLSAVAEFVLALAGAFLLFHGIKTAIDEGFSGKSLLEMIAGTSLIAVAAGLKFKSTLPLQLGVELSIALASGWLLFQGIKMTMKDGLTPESLFKIIAGSVGLIGAVVAGVFTIKKKLSVKLPVSVDTDLSGLTKAKEGAKDLSNTADLAEKGTVSLKTGVNDLLGALGKASEIIAVLGGLSIVIKTISDLLKTFSETNLSVGKALGFIAGTLGTITLAFSAMMAVMSTFRPTWETIAGSAVILLGISAVMLTISNLIETIANSGMSLDSVIKSIVTVVGAIIALMVTVVSLGMLIQSPIVLAGVLAVTGAISAILIILAKTLPIILESCAKFINDIAPSVIKLINAISGAIQDIIYTIGTVLPPIILSIGVVFDTIFKGISDLLKTFSETNLSVGEALGFIAGTLGTITLAFSAMMAVMSTFRPTWETIAGSAVILLGISAVMLTISNLIETIANSGMSLDSVIKSIVTVVGAIIALMVTVVSLGMLIQSPIVLAGVLAVTGAISAILIILAKTLPIILESCAKFINDIAPSVIKLINAISGAIQDIIYTIGTVLPPIILSIGVVFDTIFKGISEIVETVGNTVSGIIDSIGNALRNVLEGIKDVIRQIGDTISDVAYTVIWFINELGPSIENLVDSICNSVTRVVNFVISGIEYLINRVVDGVNKLKELLNNIPGVYIRSSSYVYIPRFSGYKDGGYPKEGDFFFANEAGPELIGRIGNKTAVANQDQITDGIATATYNAFSKALSENSTSKSNNDKPLYAIINVGTDKVYEGYANAKKEESNIYGLSV